MSCHDCRYGEECCPTHARDDDGQRPEYWSEIPPLVLGALLRYWRLGMRTGSFTEACLASDFLGAIFGADRDSREALPAIAAFISECIPFEARGSSERVRLWIEKHTAERRAGAASR